MESKGKHKTTIIDPQQMSALVASRSQRRNKTSLRSYKHHRDPNSPQQFTNQRQIKTIVDGKIQQLHRKMRQFFTQQRKQHLQKIAPDMQQLKQLIIQLKQQLNRPKSMQEIEREKHQLLKKKNMILEEIEEINKKVKENKKEYVKLKLEGEEVEREVRSAVATLKKYKHKMEKKMEESKMANKSVALVGVGNGGNCISLEEGNQYNNNANSNLKQKNLYKILSDSLLQDNEPNPQPPASFTLHNPQPSIERRSQLPDDLVHITEVIHQRKSQQQSKLPSINKAKRFSLQNPSKSHIIKSNSKSKINIIATNNNSSYKVPEIVVASHRNSMTKLKKKPITFSSLQANYSGTKSSTSFAALINNNNNNSIQHTLTKNLSASHLHSQFYKAKVKRSLPFDLSLQLQKYQQLVNRQKWNEVERLFDQLDDNNLVKNENNNNNHIRKRSEHVIGSSKKSPSPVNNLSELLMDQLRKLQFESYKEKGYHQGLKDKTYQIKIELKTLFKNFSPDQFFSKAMSKKAVQKQLLRVLQTSFTG